MAEENSPVFHSSLLTLQELASMKMALCIWSTAYPKRCIFPDPSKLQSTLDEFTNIPEKIKSMIESCFHPVCREMKSYYETLEKDLTRLRFDQVNHMRNHSDLVVFGGNGTVHFKHTIANFLDDEYLSVIVKFEMACVYCIEEKIDTFWHAVRHDRAIMCMNVDLRFDSCFMMYYWIFKKEDQLNRIPLRGYRTIESLMIAKCCQRRYFRAVEYFLSLLDPADRIVEINKLYESEAGYKCLRYLILHFEPPLQRRCLNERPTRILIEFVENHERIEYAVQCWFYIKDLITAENYYRDVILHSIQYRNYFEYKNDAFKYMQLEILLTEIWSSTPYRLKQYTLKNHLIDILKELSLCRVNLLPEFSRDITFLLEILSDIDIQSRNHFWMKNWSNWISGVPPAQLNQLIRLCFAETEEITNFAGTFTNSNAFQRYCDSLMSLGYHDELDEFINGLNLNQEEILKLKKHLLVACTAVFTGPRQILIEHAKYIDNVFSNETASKNFKDDLITSRKVVSLLCSEIERNRLGDVEIMISSFVSTKKNEKFMKNKFLEVVRENIVRGRLYSFDGSSWENFLMWCFGDNRQQFDDFKKSLPIDSVFEMASYKCLNFERSFYFNSGMCQCRTEDLIRFLIWYFGSESTSKGFRKDRAKHYEKIDETSLERIFNQSKETVIDFIRLGLETIDCKEDDEKSNRVGCVEFFKKSSRLLRRAVVRLCK